MFDVADLRESRTHFVTHLGPTHIFMTLGEKRFYDGIWFPNQMGSVAYAKPGMYAVWRLTYIRGN